MNPQILRCPWSRGLEGEGTHRESREYWEYWGRSAFCSERSISWSLCAPKGHQHPESRKRCRSLRDGTGFILWTNLEVHKPARSSQQAVRWTSCCPQAGEGSRQAFGELWPLPESMQWAGSAVNWSLGALLNALSNALAGGVQLSRSPAVLAGGCRQRLLG